MKIILRTAVIAALVIAASCGKDSAEDSAQQQQQEAEQLEKTPLEANTVSDNVLIAGASKENGVPPTPNEAITLDVSGTSKMALLGEGFNVSLNSDANIAGAYLRFKANDGTAADTYYDIDIDANGLDSKSGKLNSRSNKNTLISKKVDDAVLDVDFSSAIEPGTFCYEICVYDGEGNISAPQEVCVTVESWGGTADIVATWNMTKEVETYQGNTAIALPGDEDCSLYDEFECDQGGQFEANYECYIIGSLQLVFKADGTYEFSSKEIDKILKQEESKASCEAIYEDVADDYDSKGNWAYDQDAKRLVMVEYEYTEDYQGKIETGTFEPGDGEVLYDGVTVFEGNTMIIKLDDTAELQYDIHFEK